ncbi:SMC-Scp complex subunit ScpB [Planctomycetaceae bacterium]|nr:SMC-Scp complex subunit ScpB [Planctomycetaceae bacterium]
MRKKARKRLPWLTQRSITRNVNQISRDVCYTKPLLRSYTFLKKTHCREKPLVVASYLRSDELARLEAALFVAREPLPVRRLAKLARLADATRARSLLKILNALFDKAGTAFRIEHLAGGFQLITRAQFGPWVRRILDYSSENRLSNAAMETLSIIAYRQPVTRAEVEAIRGVNSEEMLRQLLDRDLIAIGGRSDDLGRPNFYITSRYFLRIFGLGRIEDLPAMGPESSPD